MCLKESEKSLELGERSLEIGGGRGGGVVVVVVVRQTKNKSTTILTIVQTGAVHSTK